MIGADTHQFVFACVNWHSRDNEIDCYGNPAQVWKAREFDVPGPAVFMPVQRILSTFAACSVKRQNFDKLVVTPMPRLFN